MTIQLSDATTRDSTNVRSEAPEISVIIPCRNAASELAGQLEALMKQDWSGSWEVIVVDNASTDGTSEIAMTFADRLPMRVVHSPIPGLSRTWNAGAKAARSHSLVFVDSDDEVAPGYLQAMSDALRENPFVAARLDTETLNEGWVGMSREEAQREGLPNHFEFLPYGAGCSLGIRRDVFEAVGGFDEQMPWGGDVDLCWRVQLAGNRLAFVPQAVVRYRYRAGLRKIYRQARRYGRQHAFLYRRFRSEGMPGPTPGQGYLIWKRMVKRLFKVRTRDDWANWLYFFGLRVGRLQGSIKNRAFYL